MPRRERALDADGGPLVEFAAGLRRLRDEAGGPGYRTLAGRAHYSPAALAAAASGRRLPTLEVTLAYVRACGGDPEEWEVRWRSLAAADDGAPPSAATDAVAPPYRGLQPYRQEDAPAFFGRRELVAELVTRVGQRPLTAVFGPSGCGKSSLLRAGLLPALEGDADGSCCGAVFTPGEHPVAELATQLARLTGAPDAPSRSRLVLVVDQFEELFTRCGDAWERRRFVAGLLAAARADRRVRVVLGVRADMYGRCMELPDLVDALRDAQVLVGAMTAAQLREAVTGPAQRSGLMVEGDLVSAVVEAAAGNQGALPLVSHALLETWRRRRGSALTLAGYQAVGGVEGAVAQTAERLYSGFPAHLRRQVQDLLLRMVDIAADGRPNLRRVPRTELDADLPQSAAVIDELARARLLTLGERTVEIAHEALLHAWPRMRDWVAEDRAGLRLHRQLSQATQAWRTLDRDPGVLYRGLRLAQVSAWAGGYPERLSRSEQTFLAASRSLERRQCRLRRVVAAVMAVLLLITSGTAAVALRNVARARHQHAVALSRLLAARAVSISDSEPVTARQVSLRAYLTSPTVEARGAVLTAASRPGYAARLRYSSAVHDTAFSRDGNLLAVASADCRVVFWDLRWRSPPREFIKGDCSIRALAFGPDGDWLATSSAGGTIALWDVATGRERRRFDRRSADPVRQIEATPDGSAIIGVGPWEAQLWDVPSGAPVGLPIPLGGDVVDVAVGRDLRLMAVTFRNGTVGLWDPRSRAQVRTLGGAVPLRRAAINPDATVVATVDERHDVALWRVADGERLDVVRTGPVDLLTFLPDGRWLISSDSAGSATVWDVKRRGEATVLPGSAEGLGDITASPDGSLIAGTTRQGTVLVWDRRSLPALAHTAEVIDVAVAEDGRSVVSVDRDGQVVTWDAATHAVRGTAAIGQSTTAVAVSPDARLVATAAGEDTIALREVASGRLVDTVVLPGLGDAIDFDPTGSMLISRPSLWFINVVSKAPHPVGLAVVGEVACLPDAHAMISVDLYGKVHEIDTGTGVTAVKFEDAGRVANAVFQPEGPVVAIAHDDGRINVWNTNTRTRIAVIAGDAKAPTMAVSPDGRLLAVARAAHTIDLWSIPSGRRWATLTTFGGRANRLTWSPDSRRLYASGSNLGVAAWWADPESAMRDIHSSLARDVPS